MIYFNSKKSSPVYLGLTLHLKIYHQLKNPFSAAVDNYSNYALPSAAICCRFSCRIVNTSAKQGEVFAPALLHVARATIYLAL